MTLQDAGYSLKLECALRDLGFVEIGWKVIAHAGLYFVSPVGHFINCRDFDDVLGFQVLRSDIWKTSDDGIRLGCPIEQTAKKALDLALNLS